MEKTREFTDLWLKNQHLVSGYVFMRVRDFHHAEDVIQETARSAVDSFHQYDRGRPFSAWVIGIARQRIVDHFRRTARKQPALSAEVLEALDTAYLQLSHDEVDLRLEAIRKCVEKLGPRHRKVIDMRYGNGLSPSQISDMIGLSANAVNALVFRARKAIADCMRFYLKGVDG